MAKRYKSIPIKKNARLAAKRGIKYYRVVRQDGELLRVAITKKPGPRGGYTIVVAKLVEKEK